MANKPFFASTPFPTVKKTSQELRMLSSVILNCQVTMTGVNLGSQLSEMSTISHKFTSHVMCLSWSLYLLLSFFWSGHVSSSLSSNVSKVTSLWDRSLMVFSKCLCLCVCLCFCLCHCLCIWLGHVS